MTCGMKWLYNSISLTLLCFQVVQSVEDPAKPAAAPEAPKKEATPAADPLAPPKGAYIQPLHPQNPFDIKGDDIDKGGDVTKACRYDDPAWSDCDAFELIRFRTLRLVSGGRQCEEAKNMTKKCTPYELPAGSKFEIIFVNPYSSYFCKLRYKLGKLIIIPFSTFDRN